MLTDAQWTVLEPLIEARRPINALRCTGGNGLCRAIGKQIRAAGLSFRRNHVLLPGKRAETIQPYASGSLGDLR